MQDIYFFSKIFCEWVGQIFTEDPYSLSSFFFTLDWMRILSPILPLIPFGF